MQAVVVAIETQDRLTHKAWSTNEAVADKNLDVALVLRPLPVYREKGLAMPPKCETCGEHYYDGRPCRCQREWEITRVQLQHELSQLEDRVREIKRQLALGKNTRSISRG